MSTDVADRRHRQIPTHPVTSNTTPPTTLRLLDIASTSSAADINSFKVTSQGQMSQTSINTSMQQPRTYSYQVTSISDEPFYSYCADTHTHGRIGLKTIRYFADAQVKKQLLQHDAMTQRCSCYGSSDCLSNSRTGSTCPQLSTAT